MTPQPDALPACPFCGGANVRLYEEDGSQSVRRFEAAECGDCLSIGPFRKDESSAIAAFTNPTHALAALQAEVERKDVELVELRARVAELTSNMQKLVEAAATLDAEKRAEVERLRKVLGEIASHEHCELWSEGQPYKPGKTPSEIYKEGIQDGHRCAASIARAALAAQGGGT